MQLTRSHSSDSASSHIPFTVPQLKTTSGKQSLFTPMDPNQIDRTLYEHRSSAATMTADENMGGEFGTLNVSLYYDAKLSLLCMRLLGANELKS